MHLRRDAVGMVKELSFGLDGRPDAAPHPFRTPGGAVGAPSRTRAEKVGGAPDAVI